MRVLFTSGVGLGHLHPKLPLARALADTGHSVAFALPLKHAGRVATAGFTAFPAGLDGREVAVEVERRFPEAAQVPPEERLRFSLTRVIQVATPPMLAGVVAAAREWRPDLIVHDCAEFAGPIAAALAGVPSVNHSWGPLLPLEDVALAADAVAPFWEGAGLAPRPNAAMFDHLYIDICPPSLQTGQIACVGPTQLLRPEAVRALPGEALPGWATGLGRRPVVHVTLGTWYNLSTDVFATVVEGLRDEDYDVIVTVGHANSPEVLGPQPPNVHVERYIALGTLLPNCDLVVAHGGAGSVLAALVHGLPMLLLPQGADQFATTARCVTAGVARSLGPADLAPSAVREAVSALLGNAAYVTAAQAVSREIMAMPAPPVVTAILQRLAAGA